MTDVDNQLTTTSYLLRSLGSWTLVADKDSLQWAQHHQRPLPTVSVQADIVSTTADTSQKQHHHLELHYQLYLNQAHPNEYQTPATWFIWDKIARELQPQDYLWQSTCLECFIAGKRENTPHHNTEYIELNVASSGNYAIYHFDDYRTPQSMPPKHLSVLLDDKYKPELQINANAGTIPTILQDSTTQHHISKQQILSRHISINIHMLSYLWDSLSSIQPALILQDQLTQQHLYFAPQHATPPDFHLSSLWTPIQHTL